MSAPQVLCIGELLFDYLADQPGRPLDAVESWTPYPGGAPANVACALTKLGTPSAYIGCLGTDAAGDDLAALLQSLNVNLEGLQRHPLAPTRTVYVTRSMNGDRTFAGFGPSDELFADIYLNAQGLPESLFEQAKFLVMGTLELAYPDSRAALDRALTLAQKHHVFRWVDLNWRPVFWPNLEAAHPLITQVLAQADFIKLSAEEADLFCNTTDPQQVVCQYPQVQGVLITDGEQGCRYWLQGNMDLVPAFSVQVCDTTGAGDAFVAGVVHQLCCHPAPDLSDPQTARRVVRYASAVGALTTTQAGAIAAQPTATEVNALIAQAD